MSSRARAVLVGGTFDPVHLGHIAVADQARRQLDAAEAWFIPSRRPPHRPPAVASADDRLAMLRAVAERYPWLRVLDVEVLRPGPSYTLDTLRELARMRPDAEQWFLLGADAARDIRAWHRVGELLATARFVLVNREGTGELTVDEAAALGFDPGRTRIIRVESPPISATEVRSRAAAGQPLTQLVPEPVARLIETRGLYRPNGGASGDNGHSPQEVG
jgi:nicotinate-nucleotide adenylyltransferase